MMEQAAMAGPWFKLSVSLPAPWPLLLRRLFEAPPLLSLAWSQRAEARLKIARDGLSPYPPDVPNTSQRGKTSPEEALIRRFGTG